MRNRALVTAVVLFAVGGGCAESIATSPECERWVADYHQKLSQSRPVQTIATKQQHLKRYVHRQIAQITHKPQVVRVASPRDPVRPTTSPSQMVKRFQILCGDLPPVETAQLVPLLSVPPASEMLPGGLTTPNTPEGPASSVVPPGVPGSPIIPGGPGPSSPGAPPVAPPTAPPSGPPTAPPGAPPTQPPSVPPTQPPTAPPAPPVPEPSGVVLMLTGTLLAAGYAALKRS